MLGSLSFMAHARGSATKSAGEISWPTRRGILQNKYRGGVDLIEDSFINLRMAVFCHNWPRHRVLSFSNSLSLTKSHIDLRYHTSLASSLITDYQLTLNSHFYVGFLPSSSSHGG